jgi:hypothetical protein
MQHEEPVTAAPDDIETKLSAVAHHEAGHMVIAAAVGLLLKPGGLSIDRVGEGLACYCFRPDETAVSQERVILATFAGWYAQKRFSDLRSISCADFAHPESTEDWCYAAHVLDKLGGKDYYIVKAELERRSQAFVEQHWPVIELLANALLAKDWEPLKLFESGWEWSKQTTARYVTGEEAVLILAEFGIQARCVSEC